MRSAELYVDYMREVSTRLPLSSLDYEGMLIDIIKQTQREALLHAAGIADQYGKCVCQSYYTVIGKHEPNAAHLDCENIAATIRAEAEKIK